MKKDKTRERMDKTLMKQFAKEAAKTLNQPLTSSIWGKRMNQIANEYLDKVPVKIHDPEFKYLKSFGIKIKDKWYKELWWSIIEFIRRSK